MLKIRQKIAQRALSTSLKTKNINDIKSNYGSSFGFKDVEKEDRQGKVNQVFSSVADKYWVVLGCVAGEL